MINVSKIMWSRDYSIRLFGTSGQLQVAKSSTTLRSENCDVEELDSSLNVMAHGDARGGSEGETGEWSG